jgi:hypothetical protein
VVVNDYSIHRERKILLHNCVASSERETRNVMETIQSGYGNQHHQHDREQWSGIISSLGIIKSGGAVRNCVLLRGKGDSTYYRSDDPSASLKEATTDKKTRIINSGLHRSGIINLLHITKKVGGS